MSEVEHSVKVFCRVRPLIPTEREGDPILGINGNRLSVVFNTPREYAFDDCLGEESSQEDTFQEVAIPLLDSFVEGYNATLFVYGQTASGKTWTMIGDTDVSNQEQRGILPRSIDYLFDVLSRKEDSFDISISFLEIYMEEIHDLINASSEKLKFRENKNREVYVDGLSKVKVGNPFVTFDVIDKGLKARRIGETKMNKRSSRSHCVFTMYLTQKITDNGFVRTIKRQLNLIDLAGSERISKTGAEGRLLKEGSTINLSLTNLSNVINAITERQRTGNPSHFIPYRDSRLTRLLQTSLGGDSKTYFIINVSPSHKNAEETMGTLEFGRRVKSIKNVATIKVEKSVEELEAENEILEAQVKKLQKILEHKNIAGDLKSARRREEIESSRSIVDFTNDEIRRISKENLSLSEELNSTKIEIERIEKENSLLKRDNIKFQETIRTQSLEAKDFQKIINDLTSTETGSGKTESAKLPRRDSCPPTSKNPPSSSLEEEIDSHPKVLSKSKSSSTVISEKLSTEDIKRIKKCIVDLQQDKIALTKKLNLVEESNLELHRKLEKSELNNLKLNSKLSTKVSKKIYPNINIDD